MTNDSTLREVRDKIEKQFDIAYSHQAHETTGLQIALKIIDEALDTTTKPTRYNWPEILKKYPWARWAATNYSGRECITGEGETPYTKWDNEVWTREVCFSERGWVTIKISAAPCPGWRDSLEPCPPELLPKG